MLILHVITGLDTGGAELMLKRLVESHRGSSDYRHVIVSLRGIGSVGPIIRDLGVEVVALGVERPLFAPAAFPRLVSEIRKRRPDIVQTWMYHADLIGGLAARAAGVRHVLWGVRIAETGPAMGSSRLTPFVRWLCASLSRTVPEVIVYVAHSARSVHEKIGYARSKGVVISNGYQVPEQPSPQPLRSELGLPSNLLLIGSAGRYNAQKDHRTFIEALKLVAEVVPHVHFVLMGRDVDPANAELRSWIRDNGVEGRVHLLGNRPDLLTCLAGLDLFCLHSVSEGFPNVVAEAMSVAVPCVVTDVGDSAFLVADTGRVVPPRRPDLLAAALISACAAPPEERQAMALAARRRIIENFSMDAIRARYEELYAGIVDAAASAERRRARPASPPR